MRKGLIGSILVSGIARTLSAISGFVVTLLVARSLPVAESGLFLLGLSLLVPASIFARLGMDNLVLKLVASDPDSKPVLDKVGLGLIWISIFSVGLSVLGVIFSDFLARDVFDKPEFSGVLARLSLILPLMSVFMTLSMAFQARQKVVYAVIFQNLGWSFIFVACFWLFMNFEGGGASAIDAANVLMIAVAAVFVLALIVSVLTSSALPSWPKTLIDQELWGASSNLWAASVMTLAVTWSGLLIAGKYLSSEEMAYFSSALRTAQLVSFILLIVNMVIAPRYARLWKQGQIQEIRHLAKWSSRGMILLVLPLVAGLLMFPESVMNIFGEGYSAGATFLVILSLGQLVNVATGSVAYLLNMTGHERDFRIITLWIAPFAVLLAFVLTVEWGGIGAALATAIGMALQNLGAMVMVRKRLGFWPVG